jgi:phage terminase small subunit
MGLEGQGTPTIPDPDEEGLGPAMRALTATQRRFAMAAVMFPFAKDWQIAKAAGYSDKSHGSLRVKAHQQFHSEKVLAAIRECADREVRGGAMLGVATIKKIVRRDDHRDQFKAAVWLAGMSDFSVEQKISVKQEFKDTTDKGVDERIRRAAEKLAKLGYDPLQLLGLSVPEPIDAEFQVIDGS